MAILFLKENRCFSNWMRGHWKKKRSGASGTNIHVFIRSLALSTPEFALHTASEWDPLGALLAL